MLADEPGALPVQPTPAERRVGERRSANERRSLTDRRRAGRPPVAAGTPGNGSAPGRPAAGEATARAALSEINATRWRSGRYVSSYAHTSLQPAEALILARYREALTGSVLDGGCGAGRILDYLVLMGAEATGIDISSRMVEYCRRRLPGVDVRVGDLADLKASVAGPFDAVVLADNVLDVFDDRQRRTVLGAVHDLLVSEGLLVFSSHNLDSRDRPAAPAQARRWSAARELLRTASRHDAAWLTRAALRFPSRRRNRRRLGPLQYREGDHAVVNDAAHDYGFLHYYIGHAGQERQLAQHGYRLIDVLEFSGPTVPAGEAGHGGSLYYVAIRVP